MTRRAVVRSPGVQAEEQVVYSCPDGDLPVHNVRELVEFMFAEASRLIATGGPSLEMTVEFDDDAARALGFMTGGTMTLKTRTFPSSLAES